MLDMLLSENRAKRLQSEKARIREYLKRLGNILKQEKDVQARTLDRDDPIRLAGEQGKIAEKTGGLSKDIKTNEESGRKINPTVKILRKANKTSKTSKENKKARRQQGQQGQTRPTRQNHRENNKGQQQGR